ncbi:MAG: glycosyltransferase [Propionibacteriaceae bacterium]|jgi:glycosyltransferase involved in cell wall biosynthesis|nr:glycosyltransferase [Propionibacteriaceae bacterium]
MDFSLLMAVYAGDDAAFVEHAYRSATSGQTRPPAQCVIVQDGPVGVDLARWLEQVETEPGVKLVRLETNQGLAAALNAGLAEVTTEVVARIDADDYCLRERFERQLALIETGLDLVGGAIAEFATDPYTPGLVRNVATTQAAIERRARIESPFHHPSVVFRKAAVDAVGGYPELRQMEDYLLWVRMLINGARVANLPEVVVHYRVGAGAFARRGGRILARSEAALQKEFRRLGFITWAQYLRNRILRGALYRHLPARLRRPAYHLWKRLGKKSPTSEGPDD